MNRIDNRKLGKFDAYIRRFTKIGNYICRVNYLTEELKDFQGGCICEIKVKACADTNVMKNPNDSKQYNIKILYTPETRLFHAQPSKIEIEVGDLVLWSKSEGGNEFFSISGLSTNNDSFNSRRLSIDMAYIHKFFLKGFYGYANVYGHQSEESGIIRVSPSGDDTKEWAERIKKPSIIIYKGGKFTPHEIEIVEGCTVIWIVQDNVEISVVGTKTIRGTTASRIFSSKARGFNISDS